MAGRQRSRRHLAGPPVAHKVDLGKIVGSSPGILQTCKTIGSVAVSWGNELLPKIITLREGTAN